MENLTTVTDYFVIATGNSTTHVGALADEADFQLGRAGVNVLRTEGHDGNRWVLLDYGSVIVHVFTPEAHDFYDLEHLWADAKELPAEEREEKPEEQITNFESNITVSPDIFTFPGNMIMKPFNPIIMKNTDNREDIKL